MKPTNNLVNASAYLVFFIPLILDSENVDYKFHANQGLNLLIMSIIIYIVGVFVPVIGWFIVLPLGGIALVILFFMGVINALNGSNKELPIIGKWQLIK